MEMFEVGKSYLPIDFLRGRSYWSNPFGYEVFAKDNGFLYVIDGDGDVRGLDFLDPLSEIPFTLENE